MGSITFSVGTILLIFWELRKGICSVMNVGGRLLLKLVLFGNGAISISDWSGDEITDFSLELLLTSELLLYLWESPSSLSTISWTTVIFDLNLYYLILSFASAILDSLFSTWLESRRTILFPGFLAWTFKGMDCLSIILSSWSSDVLKSNWVLVMTPALNLCRSLNII